MKTYKIFLIFVCMLLSALSFGFTNQDFCYAEEEMTYEEIQEKLEQTIGGQLDNLDFSDFDNIISSLDENQVKIFGSSNFYDKLKKLTMGEQNGDQQGIWGELVNLFFDDILEFMPLFSLIIAIAVAYSLVSTARPKMKKNSIGDIIHFVCYGSIIVLVMSTIISMIQLTSNTISSIKSQTDATFPILLTMLTAVGATTSSTVFQPSVALLGGTIMNVFSNILMPLFIFRLVFSIISNLTTNVKFEKFADLFSSAFKWIIGFVFTIFSGFMAIQGISAGSFDSVSIRATKYAVKSSIPILGGYISDGLNLILSSSILIKNAVGVAGLFLMAAVVVIPVLKLVVLMFSLKLTSAVLEPLTDNRISNFISMVAKSVSLLIVIIVGMAFMYFFMTGLVIGAGNYF